ncbi:hypothetical protein CHS0354_035143 [Potamilus streckersoni]|uniref:EB domain-containing protein n=1 Tax=Potamilus streckersoni TaxID=2493646 RepID=A0AAE0W0R3_9BIVA|nr:hypothetical protein CHS0354_035143 [Potamilus streckersoni]
MTMRRKPSWNEVGLGFNCSQLDACNDTYAVCNGKCVCLPGYYDDNGVNITGGICTERTYM